MYKRQDVPTDHRPLVGIFRKQLSMLENNRLMRMREKIIEFTFEVKWVEARHTTLLTHYQEHQCSLQKRRNLQSIVQ